MTFVVFDTAVRASWGPRYDLALSGFVLLNPVQVESVAPDSTGYVTLVSMGSGVVHSVVGTVNSVLRDFHTAAHGDFTKSISDPKGYIASSDPKRLVEHIVSTDNALGQKQRDQILASVPLMMENRNKWRRALGL